MKRTRRFTATKVPGTSAAENIGRNSIQRTAPSPAGDTQFLMQVGGLCCALALWAGSAAMAATSQSPEALAFFEHKIRPLLAENCWECHGADKRKGRLRLDSRDAILAGGESGPALVPGRPEESRIIKAIRHEDPDLEMPPKKRLTDRQIADLSEWVKLGAPWPAQDKSSIVAQAGTSQRTDTQRSYWAFQPVRRPAVPEVADGKEEIRNPIDAFLAAKLAGKGIQPNPPATRRELIRRAYYDLIGLPPTYEEVEAFENDVSPDAFGKLIDHLLALPQYGERWGRHWLDVVRFAQSTGYERDAEKPLAWRYRDYVIKSFNEDKPYHQFVKEQLAGDELSHPSTDSIIATGFYRLGVYDDEPADKQMAIYDEYDDYIVTTGAAFLGLTLGCARCHDHKFDPISQADYYSLLSFFRGIRGYDGEKITLESGGFVPLADPERVKNWQKELKAKLQSLEEKLSSCKAALEGERKLVKNRRVSLEKLEEQVATTLDEKLQAVLSDAAARIKVLLHEAETTAQQRDREQKNLQKLIDQTRAEKPPWDWALAVKENGPHPEPTHILIRGNPLSPGPEVQPAFLAVLPGEKSIRTDSGPAETSGRRRALAEWMANNENPLTARVLVNRVWQHHFGNGIVKTTTDFGRAGSGPTHPELLDWLAAEFMERGWSIKRLHKLIMSSAAYQRSSGAENERGVAVDPANDLLWRQNLRRLEAEAIRDTVLAVSGKLNLQAGGRGFFPHLAGEVIAGASRPGLDWEISSEDERSRRSVYAFIKRTLLAPALQNFDYSTTDSPLGERPTTTVAPQALMLLNDSFMQRQAAELAERVQREAGQLREAQVRRAYQLALGRNPRVHETGVALEFMARQNRRFERVAGRITFRPDIPESIYNAYQDKLRPEDHLLGPREGWNYYRGQWSKDYEGIRTMDRQRGPFALWTGAEFGDAVIETKIVLHRAAEFASLLFRARASNNVQSGYELSLDARLQRLILRRHTTNLAVLAETSLPIRVMEPHRLKIEVKGAEARIWFDDLTRPVLTASDPAPLMEPGRFGIRAWGAAVSLDEATINGVDGKQFNVLSASPAGSTNLRPSALQSFCLMLLNLNELVYVD